MTEYHDSKRFSEFLTYGIYDKNKSVTRFLLKKSGLQESGATEGRKNKNKTKIKRD